MIKLHLINLATAARSSLIYGQCINNSDSIYCTRIFVKKGCFGDQIIIYKKKMWESERANAKSESCCDVFWAAAACSCSINPHQMRAGSEHFKWIIFSVPTFQYLLIRAYIFFNYNNNAEISLQMRIDSAFKKKIILVEHDSIYWSLRGASRR